MVVGGVLRENQNLKIQTSAAMLSGGIIKDMVVVVLKPVPCL